MTAAAPALCQDPAACWHRARQDGAGCRNHQSWRNPDIALATLLPHFHPVLINPTAQGSGVLERGRYFPFERLEEDGGLWGPQHSSLACPGATNAPSDLAEWARLDFGAES